MSACAAVVSVTWDGSAPTSTPDTSNEVDCPVTVILYDPGWSAPAPIGSLKPSTTVVLPVEMALSNVGSASAEPVKLMGVALAAGPVI